MDITECDICHDRDFEDVLNSIHYSSLNPDHEDDEVIEISPLRIVSVVVCTELRDTVLDLGLIYENLKSLEYVDVEDISYQEERPSKKEKKEQKKEKKKTMFYNCMLWKIQVRDGLGDNKLMNVSLKCFPNGKFQYAGFNTIHAIKLIPRIVTSIIRKIDGGMDPCNTKLDEPRIIQINSSFYILKAKGKQIKQIILNDLLLKKEHLSVGGRVISSTFMPEKYPGINVKFKVNETAEIVGKRKKEPTITLLIFSTGSVLINGYNNISEYREAYVMLCKLVHEHRDMLITDNLLN